MTDRTHKPLTAVVFGLGVTGRKIVEILLDREVRIVAAVDAFQFHGLDVGAVLGWPDIGVSVIPDAEAAFAGGAADIAIVSTQNGIRDIYPTVKLCLENDTDVITIAGDAYFPWVDQASSEARALHELAVARGKTILGTGVQDVFWDNMPVLLSGAAESITGIHGRSVALVDSYGDWIAEGLCIGKAPEELDRGFASPFAGVFIGPLHDIAHRFGLTVIDAVTTVEPVIARKAFRSEEAGIEVSAGHLSGLDTCLRLNTVEGVTLSARFISKLREDGDSNHATWDIEGSPGLSVFMQDRHDIVTTSATVVNRIPDVINAAPGFTTVSALPAPMFRFRPLGAYAREGVPSDAAISE